MLASFDFGSSVLGGDFGGSEWGSVDFLNESDVLFSLPFFWLLLVGVCDL